MALIDDGRMLLFGDLAVIKRQRGANSVQVQARRIPDDLTDSRKKAPRNGAVEYPIEEGRTPRTILKSYLDAGIDVERFEMSLPSLNDIFIEEVFRERSA